MVGLVRSLVTRLGHDRFYLINLLTVKIVKVLGEGGFSFVYLAQDETSGVSKRFAPRPE